MTYEEFRQFGWVSPLSQMLVCKFGANDSTINQQKDITQSQVSGANTANQWSQEDRANKTAWQSPLISKLTALSGGDRNAALEASMPVISKIAGGFGSAKQNILNSIPAGAARDKALADLEVNRATTTAGTQAQLVNEAPTQLAQLGSESGQSALQELGAMFAGLQGGALTNQSTGQMEAQKNAAMLNFFSNLASTGASIAMPFLGAGKAASPGVSTVAQQGAAVPASINWSAPTLNSGATKIYGW